MSDDFDDDDHDFHDYDYDYDSPTSTSTNMKLDCFSNYTSNNASWIIEYKDTKGETKFEYWAKQGCFGTMSCFPQYVGKDIKNLYVSLLVNNNNKKDILPYWKLLFDPKISPWRVLFPGGDVEVVTHEKSKTPYFRIPISHKTPSQAIVSLAIASRAGAEAYYGNVTMYNLLLEKGWTEHEALFGSIYMGQIIDPGTKKPKIVPGFTYDWYAFTACNNNVYQWLVDGTPRLNPANTFSAAPYGPIQDIWLKKDLRQDHVNIAAVYEKITSVRSYDGVFPVRFKSTTLSDKMPFTSLPPLEKILEKKKEIFANG